MVWVTWLVSARKDQDKGYEYYVIFHKKSGKSTESFKGRLSEKKNADYSSLTRPRHPMPDFVREALEIRGHLEAYRERPAYQQNDYIHCITTAKLRETREKRLNQMLDELEKGGVYMNMRHPLSAKK